jgi:hypothetical protein
MGVWFGCNLATLEPSGLCGDVATWAAAVVTFVGVFIATVAAALAWAQITSARKIAREALARQTYSEYLKLAMEHPEFSSGLKQTVPPSDRLFEQYEWFVSYMLNACEGILLYVSTVKKASDWTGTIVTQVEYHKDYFESSTWFQESYEAHYEERLRKIIENVCGWNEAQAKTGSSDKAANDVDKAAA